MAEKSKGQATREHILQVTRQLFTKHGFGNTSISTIIAATGVKKGNLYYHFPSKDDLGLAVLLDAKAEFALFLEESFVGDDPLDEILNSCDMLFEMMQSQNFVGGCLFGNAALEMTESHVGFSRIIQDVFTYWTARIEANLRKAESMGLLHNTMALSALATTVVAAVEGGIMMSRVSKGGKGLDDCLLTLKSIFAGLRKQKSDC